MGKGSRQRPTDAKRFSENWDRIFNKKQQDSNKTVDKSQKI